MGIVYCIEASSYTPPVASSKLESDIGKVLRELMLTRVLLQSRKPPKSMLPAFLIPEASREIARLMMGRIRSGLVLSCC
jgi:hypothetical protein